MWSLLGCLDGLSEDVEPHSQPHPDNTSASQGVCYIVCFHYQLFGHEDLVCARNWHFWPLTPVFKNVKEPQLQLCLRNPTHLHLPPFVTRV